MTAICSQASGSIFMTVQQDTPLWLWALATWPTLHPHHFWGVNDRSHISSI